MEPGTRPAQRKRLVIGVVAVTLVGAYLALKPEPMGHPFFLYVIDARADRSEALDVSRVFAEDRGVVVETISRDRVPPSPYDPETAFRDAALPGDTSAMFIRIEAPSVQAMMALRADLESRIDVAGGADLLRRLVPVLGPDGLDDPGVCDELSDQIMYADWVFRGLGIVVDDATASILQRCGPLLRGPGPIR